MHLELKNGESLQQKGFIFSPFFKKKEEMNKENMDCRSLSNIDLFLFIEIEKLLTFDQ